MMKLGTPSPTTDTPRPTSSTNRPGLSEPNTPKSTPMSSPMIMEAMASSRVIGSAAPTSDATEVREVSETPRLPVKMAPSHEPNCWKNGSPTP